MERIAPYVAHNLSKLYSLEMWGGGIFEQSIQYLRECPWERLERLRKKIPNIPFQMLLRGSNTVGYACNPDNVVARFCELAVQYGIDIFRIFDSLNYYPNMRITMDAVGNAGGIIEAAMAYTGDVCNKDSDMYNLEYYMNLADQFIRGGAHILTIKDMAGLLRPKAGRILIDALRQRYPDIPIHVHTHDTAGVAVACMLACAEAGADIIDCSVDSMSGMTSQPSMGAMVACLDGSSIETGLSPTGVSKYSTYWQMTRQQYASFDCTVFLKSGSADVFEHQMPGAQYSWSQFQAYSLGLVDYFEAYKKKYKEADTVLGCIPKVSPSSRVVRELARFMLEHKLTPESLRQKIDQLTLPASVVSFFKGEIGQPPYGFPEPLRTYILREKKKTSYHRPGSHLPPLEFGLLRKQLQRRHNKTFRAIDLVSAAIMPTEFDEFERFRQKYGPTSRIPTKVFFEGLSLGESVDIEIETGKTLYIRYLASGSLDKRGYRHLYFELNGQIRVIPVFDRKATMNKIERVQANKEDIGSVGSPVSGEITDIKVRIGEKVKLQQPLFTVRANENIESVAEAPCAGYVSKICCKLADTVEANDLVVIIKSQDTEVQHYDDE
ncbi:hypothetical protein AB6A40_008839 [Gnathostoma spinigerum]|uniref:Pyruvate carboxyltransferase domain-containing protein n=1 Tax=Gnathostoma spinigerum TaxID=75299 RepID=A0ABD6EQ85_9BILA